MAASLAVYPPHCFPTWASLGHLVKMHQSLFVRNLNSRLERTARLSCHHMQHVIVTQLRYMYLNGNYPVLDHCHPNCSQDTMKRLQDHFHISHIWQAVQLQPAAVTQRTAEDCPAGGRHGAICSGHCVCLWSLQESALAGCPSLWYLYNLPTRLLFLLLQKVHGSCPNQYD